MSASNAMTSSGRAPQSRSRGPKAPVTGLRTACAAVWMSLSANARKNCKASKRFDLPTPFGPTKHVSGPKRTVTSRRFLKPRIRSRRSMVRCDARC